MTPPKKGSMSQEHKDALAEGRSQGRAVRNYLEALEANRPKRGRKRTPDSIKKQLAKIDEQIGTASPVQRLQLTQQRIDLEADLAKLDQSTDLSKLEKAFVAAAKEYGERKGISYTAWREVGVPAAVLKKAGVGRGD